MTGAVSLAYAELMKVTDNYRISHPAHSMTDVYNGDEDSPWNQDGTRIILYENGSNHPSYPTARSGKGLVWGKIAELKANANGAVAAWEAVAHPLGTYPSTFGNHATWSRLPGETNIIYAVDRTRKALVRLDTDTGIAADVVSVDSGGSQLDLGTQGWTSDSPPRLIIAFAWGNWSGGFYEMSGLPSSPVKVFRSDWPGLCTADNDRYPSFLPRSIHESRSPDRQYRNRYSASNAGNDGIYINSGANCNINQTTGFDKDYPDKGNAAYLTHISWRVNEWFVGANSGDSAFDGYSKLLNATPRMDTYTLEQVFFDRNTHAITHNQLLSVSSSAFRLTTVPGYGGDMNYQGGIPSPTVKSDGRQLHYMGTGGKWSQEDKAWCDYMGNPSPCLQIQADYAMYAVFLADLAPVSGGNDTQSPTAPAGVTATAVSGNQIDLSWSASTDNVGVSGYRIYREGVKVATTTNTNYSDTGLALSTTYSYQVSAYDAANNESAKSAPSSATTRSSSGLAAFTILKTTTLPRIDGNLSEYSSANPVTFAPASGGNTVTVKALWDTEALYIGINVTDSHLDASSVLRDGSVWNDDSMEWFIDKLNDKGGSANPNSAYMLPDDYHGIVNILNTQFDSQGTVSGSPSGSWDGNWQSVVMRNITNNNFSGYNVEIKIPWASIGYVAAPADNTVIGMSFVVNDKDASSSAHLMWPNLANVAFENASNWQNVLLSVETALPKTALNPPKLLRFAN